MEVRKSRLWVGERRFKGVGCDDEACGLSSPLAEVEDVCVCVKSGWR